MNIPLIIFLVWFIGTIIYFMCNIDELKNEIGEDEEPFNKYDYIFCFIMCCFWFILVFNDVYHFFFVGDDEE